MGVPDDVVAAIHRAIDDVNRQLPASSRLAKRGDTVLFGRDEGLDSLGVVNLLVAVEQHLERLVGRPVSLAIEEMMLEPASTVMSVDALRDYVLGRLQTAAARD